jgi:hypothetical protein
MCWSAYTVIVRLVKVRQECCKQQLRSRQGKPLNMRHVMPMKATQDKPRHGSHGHHAVY